MPKISDLKFSKLGSDRYKDVTFKLHFITDISTKPGENYYNAIFKSQKARTDFDITEEIPPELLCYYTIDTFYREGKRTGKSKYLELLPIKFPLSDGKILKIKEINEATNHSVSGENKKYIRSIENQYAYFGRLDEYYVVIPCHVIGSAFYFTSTTMHSILCQEKGYYFERLICRRFGW